MSPSLSVESYSELFLASFLHQDIGILLYVGYHMFDQSQMPLSPQRAKGEKWVIMPSLRHC